MDGRYGQKKLHNTIFVFMSVNIDNYHGQFQIFIYFKFKARFLLLGESCRNQTVNCGLKLFMSEHDKHLTLVSLTK